MTQRLKTDKSATDHTAFLPKAGTAREEHYQPKTTEPFGLNKRTRRAARGERVTLPNGSYPDNT